MTNWQNLVKKTRLAFCGFCLVLIAHTSRAQTMQDHYRIFSVKENKEVALEAIVNDMATYAVLFFGEEHNDSVTHYLQNLLFEKLYQQFSGNLALSLEMFDRDVQTIMNEYLSGAIRERNFTKDARVWNNYADYRPMVEFAKTHQLSVICANAPTRYTNLAGRKGQAALLELPKETKKYFAPLPYQVAEGKYYEKLMGVMGHVPSTTTDTSTKKMPAANPMGDFDLIASQSLWDATMAWSIVEYLKKNKSKKVMQVNGRFHSDEGFAIVTQLKKYRPKTTALIISAGTDESFPAVDWSKHKQYGDYIIITDPKVKKTF